MKNNVTIEIITGLLLAILVAVLTYAHEAWMPNMATMVTLALIVAAFGIFAVYVWGEDQVDEREQLIRFVASRAAFLATGSVLLIGIIVETLIDHQPSPWLGLALVVMVGAKIIGHAYGRNKY
ncbi:hypothetical protein COB18_01330 [Candidatus Kaiserbacteria bacterium]|nr:MAG: hypothetical protein COB80_02775 [Candidatus Kaiserbacteria bacterium]PCI90371.1 MAG: hypothetical protein COB18_01330 [Candidatus Kaiserbacteria bacterium]